MFMIIIISIHIKNGVHTAQKLLTDMPDWLVYRRANNPEKGNNIIE